MKKEELFPDKHAINKFISTKRAEKYSKGVDAVNEERHKRIKAEAKRLGYVSLNDVQRKKITDSFAIKYKQYHRDEISFSIDKLTLGPREKTDRNPIQDDSKQEKKSAPFSHSQVKESLSVPRNVINEANPISSATFQPEVRKRKTRSDVLTA